MNSWFLVLPLISALIGWFLNSLLIKLLFQPREPKRFFGVMMQGVFQRRKLKLAEQLGSLAEKEFSSLDIETKISDPSNLNNIMPFIESHVDVFLKQKLGEKMPMIKMFVGERTMDQMKDIFMTELKELFPLIMEKYAGSLKESIDIKGIVSRKVAAIPAEKFEAIINMSLAKEVAAFKTVGALGGFIIGALQVLIGMLIA